jgi:hypothetical protein
VIDHGSEATQTLSVTRGISSRRFRRPDCCYRDLLATSLSDGVEQLFRGGRISCSGVLINDWLCDSPKPLQFSRRNFIDGHLLSQRINVLLILAYDLYATVSVW